MIRQSLFACVVMTVVMSASMAEARKAADKAKQTQAKEEVIAEVAAEAPAASVERSADALRVLGDQVMAALADDNDEEAMRLLAQLRLVAPERWFAKTFGAAQGAGLLAEYRAVEGSMETDLLRVFRDQYAKKRRALTTYCVNVPSDIRANDHQIQALRAMKVKVPVYGLRFYKEGGSLGYHMYNFVYVDGGFRYIGNLAMASQQ